MQIEWSFKRFSELSPYEVYAILQLRNEVFVVEQNCVFQDADDRDQDSYHLIGTLEGMLVAYTRIVPQGVIYPVASIGRVVTSPSVRKKSAGKQLMAKSIEALYSVCGIGPIKIGAQLYLRNFYQSFGFVQISDTYLEDGIPHIYMLKEPVS